MKRIREIKKGKESIFIVDEIFANEKINTYKIHIDTVINEINSTLYYSLYNSNFEIIQEAFEFLNFRNKKLSKNTNLQALYALKYLYIFSEIIEKKVPDFKYEDFQKLLYFLKGISANGTELELSLLTKRGSNTVNTFFTTYRNFYNYLNINNSPIFYNDRMNTTNNSIRNNKSIHYSVGLKSNVKNVEVPKYISPSKFKKIIEYIRNNTLNKEERLRNEAIIRIMYEGGLRLGEVLGLTLEDLVIKQINENNDDTDEICFVYIRNRISDRNFQHAKTCMKVFNKRTYESFEYNTNPVGYQLSFLNLDTYDLIDEYINIAHDRAYKNNKQNYFKFKADSVQSYKEKSKDNFYVFLNNRSTPLSDESWNTTLRKIFGAVGIDIDYKTKRNNLSHRFRHGFVMHLIHDLKLPIEQVMRRSRHTSHKGLDCYYNPTTTQLIKMKTDIEDELYKLDI